MRSLWICYRKEMLEMKRSYKLLWIPAVFILIGMMQPITAYYMPEILKMSGDVPKGILDSYQIPGAGEVMAKSLGQYGMIGLLVLVLSAMNGFAGEREGGIAELFLSRPVSTSAAASAKWLAHLTLLVLSLGLGSAFAAYYTIRLIGELQFGPVLAASAVYGLWLMCGVSLTLLFSSFLRAPAAAFLGLGVTAVLSLLHQLLPGWLRWSPAALTQLSAGFLDPVGESTRYMPILSGLLLIACCIGGAAMLFRRNKLPHT
ncbi:ABC transporter permease subunit [Paenibacillus sp. HN-1]|uniref:ABC transporter permease subunit n=1 Tax=Paenibacillus TaxID=44249 RepID=UPI001CA82F55|nr:MULTISPECIES: ABC transporter permease subunit [Paenibacillus]MBY9077080.1 ABC transporter permease subunit [Paenibacillus sp. CGMCC 1.18879]MBY9086547.1 ABC transporter permease subunit [Paenibacillus sinensis]